MKLYCISGLGADHTAFENLQIDGVEVVHLKWIDPRPKESLKAYANRLGEAILDNEPFYMAGLSMGGMIAQEIAKKKVPDKLFLISTVRSSDEIPAYLRTAGKLKFPELVPDILFEKHVPGLNTLFTATTDQQISLVKRSIEQSTPQFLKWSIRAILGWKNSDREQGIRIHGEKDRLLPVNKDQVDYCIPEGGHLMILSHANRISEIINNELKNDGVL